jgi:FAD synthetase
MKTILVFGCFDILHPGHLFFLGEAKKLGDRLVAVVARDSTLRALKKREPVLNEQARLEMVRSLRVVDDALLGGELERCDRYEIIKAVRPDVIALGYDQAEDEGLLKRKLREMRVPARVVRIKRGIGTKAYKSSKILSKISEIL